MRGNMVVVGSVGVLILVPLVLLWYSRRHKPGKRDRMDDIQHVRKKKEKIVKNTEINKEDVRFVIGRKGCVIRDIEGRCNVKISFPELDNSNSTQLQTVSIKGDCNDDISEAIEMIEDACQLKPQILTELIEIRAEYCGKVIGKGGENMKDIREKSGTRILIDKEPVEGHEELRLCRIEGTKEEIEVAKQLIDSNIMTEIDIRRRREHRQAVKDYQSYSSEKIAVQPSASDSCGIIESESSKSDQVESEISSLSAELPNLESAIPKFETIAAKSGDYQEPVCETVLLDDEVICTVEDVPAIDESNTEVPCIESHIQAVTLSHMPEPMSSGLAELQVEHETQKDIALPTLESPQVDEFLEYETSEDASDSEADTKTQKETVSVTLESPQVDELLEDETPEDTSASDSEKGTRTESDADYSTGRSELTTVSSDQTEETTSSDLMTSLESKPSLGFTVELSSDMDMFRSNSEESFDKVRSDIRIDEDIMQEVTLKTQDELSPHPLLDSVCLPPLAPPQDIGSASIETLVPGTPPNCMLFSNESETLNTSTVDNKAVNKRMTDDLKSMLGIQLNNNGESRVDAMLAEEEPTPLRIIQSLYQCDVYSYYPGGSECSKEFSGIVTNARCTNHVWVVNRYSSAFEAVSKMLSSIQDHVPLDCIIMNNRYLFIDRATNTNCRVTILHSISKTLVECYDIDTGLQFSAPVRCLAQLPNDLMDLPATAVCLSIGTVPCVSVRTSELIGKLVTVKREDMGANKDVKYPRVKLLNRDQIVYSNYRQYVSSPKHTDSASLPTGSSLVYVSAIHNAGHFYVQVCGKNISELDQLETAMAEHYGTVDTLPEYTWNPTPGQLCGVWHTAEQIWLRGQVKELDNSDMLYIKYLDYGDTVLVPRSYTRKLRSEFKELPYQAIECFLANTIPITTRQWTPDATAKFDALTQCGQWYPLRCVVVGERLGKPCVELYDQPYSEKEYSVGECLCAMDYARSSKMEIPAVQTLSTPIPSFASGAAYLVSPDFDDVDDELEELFACDDDSDSADSDDFPISRANVSNILLSLSSQISPGSNEWKNTKNNSKYRPQTCGTAKNNAFMERRDSTDSHKNSSEETTPKPEKKNRYNTQESLSDTDNTSESDQSNFYETPLGSTTSSYSSAAEFNNTFVAPPDTPYHSSVTPLHLSSAEDTDCG